MIEPLEARIAPASLTFTDVDGDHVVITTSAGALTRGPGGNVIFDASGQQLQMLVLTDPAFQGASVSIVATRDPTGGGDGRVHVGSIQASGRDLGTVLVDGALGAIDAGDPASPASACKGLTVRSLGAFATPINAPDVTSDFDGKLSRLTVRSDVEEAIINVTDSAGTKGKIGPVFIGGSLFGGDADQSGSINARDGIGFVIINAHIIGGGGTTSGAITCTKDLAGVSVGEDIFGGAGFTSGVIFSALGAVGPVNVGGSIVGGDAAFTGRVFAKTTLASVTVGGSLKGGTASDSGRIHSDGDIGFVTIGDDVVGGSATKTGRIDVGGKIGAITIGGSLVGGSARESGTIVSGRNMGVVNIAHDVRGGAAKFSGEIFAGFSRGKLRAVTIGGSLFGGGGDSSGAVTASGGIGAVTVGGDVQGGSSFAAHRSGAIFSDGDIPSIAIGGSLIGGSGTNAGSITSNSNIGTVEIGGDMRGASITGNAATLDESGSIRASRIGSVFIGGSVLAGSDDSTGGDLTGSASIRAVNHIGAIFVNGAVIGTKGSGGITEVIISARGQQTLADSATRDLAIQSLTIGGNVLLTNVLAGFFPDEKDTAGSNGNASIGFVKVRGNWTQSSISAGVQDGGSSGFGTTGDQVIDEPPGAPADAIIARIAGIKIKGVVQGTAGGSDHFGFVAQQIGSFKSAGFTAVLTAGTDAPIEISPNTGDVTIREVA